MPLLLSLDLACLGISLAVTAALVLIVGAAGIRKGINRAFVFAMLLEMGWALGSVLLRLSLWFDFGNPSLMLVIASASFALMAPCLFLFTARYVQYEGAWPGWAAAGLLALTLALALPLLGGRFVGAPVLNALGAIKYPVSAWGVAAGSLTAATLVASLLLLWLRRRVVREPLIAASFAAFLTAFVVGGLIQLGVPIMSVTTSIGVGLLGWAIMRRHLFNPLRDLAADLRERSRRQELISQISRQTATYLELDELLQQTVALVRASFEYFSVGILLVEGNELVLRASTLAEVQAQAQRFRLAIGAEGICGIVAESGEPINVPDVSRDPRYVALAQEVRTRSELAVPIRWGSRVIGVLDTQSAQVGAFSPSDVITLQTIADQLSSAIENARLYEQTRRRAERLAVVNRISAAIGSTLDLGDLLETVYREVTPVFEADAFFIALYDEERNELDFRIQVDEHTREAPDRSPVGEGLTSRVIVEKKPLLVNDLARGRNQDSSATAWGTGKMPTSWIGVPMLVGERIVGVLSVQTYGLSGYDAEDLLLAATIGDQVAIAVENARLYQNARQELVVRQRTEKVLRESEEKFRNLAEQTPNMIFIWSRGRVVYANRQCELSMGYSREEFYAEGFRFQSLIEPGSLPLVETNLRRHLAGADVPPYEYSLITREGRRIDAILTSKLIRYEAEPAVLGISTDITMRTHAERLLLSLNEAALAMEQALAPSEIFPLAARMLSSLGIDSVVFLADAGDSRGLCVHCWGDSATGEVSLEHGGEAGSPLFRIDAVPTVAAAMDSRRAVHAALDSSMLASMHAGSPAPAWVSRFSRWPNAIIAPLCVGDENFGLLAVAGKEVAAEDLQVFTAFAHQAAAAWRKTRLMQDLEASLQQLRRAQEQLLHAQKMEAVGRLAGGIAHDFNNILTVISGYTALLADQLDGDAPALADLGQIRVTIKRASALTSRLLAFSRKQILQPVVLDLNKVISSSLTLLRPLIGEDVELVVRLTPAPALVSADPSQMEQVLMNLAVNARDAMPGGGRLVVETAYVEVAADGSASACGAEDSPLLTTATDLLPGQWVMLRVQDNGVGMSEETRARLFEPFFTTKDEGKGSGLGLSTVYGIVSQSGGRIKVESALGRGSVFTAFLPREQIGSERAPEEEQSASPAGGSGTVLLVEDEADVRELSTRVLEKAGYRVIPVSSARDALLVAEGSAVVDVVVTDVVMPGGMSGIEMGDRLSRSRPTLPVLYMSGYAEDMRVKSGSNGSKLPFLGKPFQPADLLRHVREMIGR